LGRPILARLPALALALLAGTLPARALENVPGHVIVARSSDDALLLWDATDDVADVVRLGLSGDDAGRRLRHDALRMLAASLDRVPGARTITLRVLYSKTGDVSPVYGSPTFAGVERYASVTIDSHLASGDRDRWKELAANAALPAWIHYRIEGDLPPP
jgi:hypothetical protein